MHDPQFQVLLSLLARIPSVGTDLNLGYGFGSGIKNGRWWVKFSIDIDHSCAWHVVQELGHVLNYLSLDERLPTTFKPVSPPVYLNGGPRDFLSWVIECDLDHMTPNIVADWLESRLPSPIDGVEEWTRE